MLTAERLRNLLEYDRNTGIFRWRESQRNIKAGSIAGHQQTRQGPNGGYWLIDIDCRRHLAHRLAWLHFYGEWPPGNLDHEDNCRTHNWISNLRPASDTQNQANSRLRISNTSGFKGVCFNRPCAKWQASIQVNGKSLHLGLFTSAEAAHAAYLAAAVRLFGEFARSA